MKNFSNSVGIIEDLFDNGEPVTWNVSWEPSNVSYTCLETCLELDM